MMQAGYPTKYSTKWIRILKIVLETEQIVYINQEDEVLRCPSDLILILSYGHFSILLTIHDELSYEWDSYFSCGVFHIMVKNAQGYTMVEKPQVHFIGKSNETEKDDSRSRMSKEKKAMSMTCKKKKMM